MLEKAHVSLLRENVPSYYGVVFFFTHVCSNQLYDKTVLVQKHSCGIVFDVEACLQFVRTFFEFDGVPFPGVRWLPETSSVNND